MRNLIIKIVSGLILSTVLISTFFNGEMISKATEENINLFQCYVDDTEKKIIDSQIQSFNSDTSNETKMYCIGSSGVNDISFIINNCDLDNSYKIYSVGLIDANTTDLKSCISSNCKIEVPFINENGEINLAVLQQTENGIEFVGIKFGENIFPSISEIYSLIDNYFPNTYIDEVKFIDLKQYGKMCIYVSANEKQYLIDITNNNNIYTIQDFINNLDLSINDIYKNNESGKAIYVGRNISNNKISIDNTNTQDNKNINCILIISCAISVIIILVSVLLLKKKKD